MIRAAGIAGATILLVALGITGCAPAVTTPAHHTHAAAPSPTATPTATAPPALSDLVLSPDGLGPLVIGSPVPDQPAASAIVLWNPTKCGTTGAWLPNYPDGPLGPNGEPTGSPFYFALDHKSDPLTYINVASTQIKTSAGISIGSTLAELKAAYPHFDSVEKGPLTDLYEINGQKAKLVIEVAQAGTDPAWDGKVVLMEVNGLGSAPGSLFGNDAGGGICPGP